MGEIADALRRAREQRSSQDAAGPPPASPTPSEARRASRPTPSDPGNDFPTLAGAAPPAQRAAARSIDSLTPTDPAIVLKGPSVETFRGVALRVRRELAGRRASSVAIVSAVREEGKTTVLCDIGLALASLSSDHNVALVDLDLRKPSIARMLGVSAEKGIEDVLRGDATLDQIRISVNRPRVDIYPAVKPQRDAHELLALPSFAATIGRLEKRYAEVLFDTPPTLLLPDTSLILGHVATCIVVARSGETRVRYLRQLTETLPKHRILGEFLNAARATRYSYGYYYSGAESDSGPTKAEDLCAARQS